MAKIRRGKRFAAEKHKDRKRIDKDIISGVPLQDIADWCGITRQALARYRDSILLPKVVKVQQAVTERHESVTSLTQERNLIGAAELLQIITDAVDRVRKLGDACDAYLQDPEDPTKYFLGDREEEVHIVGYREDDEGKRYAVKGRLSDILARLDGEGITVTSITSTKADPRMLLVRSSDTLSRQLEALTLAWQAAEQHRISFASSSEWAHLVEQLRSLSDGERKEIISGLKQSV